MTPRKSVVRRVKSKQGDRIVQHHSGTEKSVALSYDFNITDSELEEYKKHLTNAFILRESSESDKQTIIRTYEIAAKLIKELEEVRGVINNTAPVIEKMVEQIAELRESIKE